MKRRSGYRGFGQSKPSAQQKRAVPGSSLGERGICAGRRRYRSVYNPLEMVFGLAK
ncbi:MAG: hypothetical protein KC766_39295 [Myxococcales bacterium]|nr:hypothetical protein [Myxococcales bacterium]